MTVAQLRTPYVADAVDVLREALARAEAGRYEAVIVIGYRANERAVEIRNSANRGTDAIVGAMERAKWELLANA